MAVLWGTMGCGETREQGGDHMVDGPDMVYTLEDQSPFAGTWQNADESIVLEIEGIGQFEASRMNLTVDGVVKLTSDMWVYKTGYVKLTEGYNDVLLPEPFSFWNSFIRWTPFACTPPKERPLCWQGPAWSPRESSPSGTEKHV